MTIYDVLIVGAGPAGGTAAYNCAKLGLKTLLIEEHKIIGEPVHCGECLSHLALENLGIELPDKVISEKVKGIRVFFPGNKESVVNEKGYVLEKNLFEQWIAEEATKEGAEVKLNTKLIELKRENNVWKTKVKQAGKEKIIQSKIVIDASGVAQIVSRLTGLNEKSDRVTGIQYELRNIPRDGYLDFYIWPRLAPHGYLWMIPKRNGRANIGLVTTEITNAKKYLDKFVEEMGWKNKVLVKTFGGAIPSSGPLKKTFDKGLMLIGDAAGFTSPLFEGGSHLGMKSGFYSAQVAKKAIDLNNFSREVFAEYERMWKNEFPPYDKIIKGKNSLYSMTDEELKFIASKLPKDLTTMSLVEKAKIGVQILLERPSLIKKDLKTTMDAFKYSRAQYYGW